LAQPIGCLLGRSTCGVPFTLKDIDPSALIGASSEPVDLRRQSAALCLNSPSRKPVFS
jgi:hypothetical protein